MDASQRIGDLIVISQRLAEILAMENHALRSGRVAETQAMVEQKDELCRAYESRIKGLSEHADAATMNVVEPALKDQLRTMGEEIRDLSQENAQLLRIAMEVNRRVIHEIATAVKASQPHPGTYSKTGNIATPLRPAAISTPISLDKSL